MKNKLIQVGIPKVKPHEIKVYILDFMRMIHFIKVLFQPLLDNHPLEVL
ncbi:hypothetical protein [Bacillus sp. AK031]